MDEERLAELVEEFKRLMEAGGESAAKHVNNIYSCLDLAELEEERSAEVAAEIFRDGNFMKPIMDFADTHDLNPQEFGTMMENLFAPHFDRREQELGCVAPLIG